jgi:hypothetical protein
VLTIASLLAAGFYTMRARATQGQHS